MLKKKKTPTNKTTTTKKPSLKGNLLASIILKVDFPKMKVS